MDTIDGTLSRILHHKPSRFSPAGVPFLIGKLADGRVVKGEMWQPVEGESYRFWGSTQPQKGPYGDAFEFYHHEPVIPQTSEGVSTYLRNHIKGLGFIRSAAIVNHLGDDTLTILRTTPERASEVKGVTAEIVAAIKSHFQETRIDPVAYAELVDMFAGFKIPKRVITSLMKHYNSDAPRKVRENPYVLLTYPRIGWKTADGIALSEAVGYAKDGMERQKAAILESLDRVADQGHTYGTMREVDELSEQLLGHQATEAAFNRLQEDGEIVDPADDGRVSHPSLWVAESEIARRLDTLQSAARQLVFETNIDGLSDEQRAALEIIRDNGVSLLIGPPGTGKTYTITTLISALIAGGSKSIRVAAPTGKAAKRAAELLSRLPGGSAIPCTTIHKLLGPVPNDAPDGIPAEDSRVGRGRDAFSFKHNENEPIEADFLVIDETSMVDVELGADLLRAIPPGCRLVFVGDENQLPSVGPGSVLRDLIDGGIPTARLSTIQRSDGGGRVVKACHSIMRGMVPEPAPKLDLPTENWRHIEVTNPRDIGAQIVELISPGLAERFGLDLVWDVQVISPQKKTPGIGCDALNRALSAKLNPLPLGGRDGEANGNGDGTATQEGGDSDERYRVGDKVIRVKNGVCDRMVRSSIFERADWKWRDAYYQFAPCEVVNGDMGTVLDILTPDQTGDRTTWVVVVFRNPDRLCRLAYTEAHIQQAYAVTVHKAQGSGFPVVIAPVHESFYFDERSGQGLWNRELFYTLISRSELACITVGSWGAVRKAIGRKTVGRRRTRLAGLIKKTTLQETLS